MARLRYFQHFSSWKPLDSERQSLTRRKFERVLLVMAGAYIPTHRTRLTVLWISVFFLRTTLVGAIKNEAPVRLLLRVKGGGLQFDGFLSNALILLIAEAVQIAPENSSVLLLRKLHGGDFDVSFVSYVEKSREKNLRVELERAIKSKKIDLAFKRGGLPRVEVSILKNNGDGEDNHVRIAGGNFEDDDDKPQSTDNYEETASEENEASPEHDSNEDINMDPSAEMDIEHESNQDGKGNDESLSIDDVKEGDMQDELHENGDIDHDLNELVQATPNLASGETFAGPISLAIRSEVLGFPPDLREAISWFLAEETQTAPEKWLMTFLRALKSPPSSYHATFTAITSSSIANRTKNKAINYVTSQGLTKALVAVGAEGVLVVLWEQSRSTDSAADLFEDFIAPMAPLSPRDTSPAQTNSPPKKSHGQVLLELPIHLIGASPSRGVVKVIVRECARQTKTRRSDWVLTHVGKESESENNVESEKEEYELDFVFRVLSGQKLKKALVLSNFVRSRSLDEVLWKEGFVGAHVRLRPRLRGFTGGSDTVQESGNGITSNAATIAASVIGLVLVVSLGAGIMCLVPRLGGSSKSQATQKENDD